ncbi:unnamed protein product [Linum trigynum]|uniref:Nodulin-like domain-containing protein n=1 Tax=Linum trigynum TaxID=586398 RepID=A0AAV2DI93_9ROSI
MAVEAPNDDGGGGGCLPQKSFLRQVLLGRWFMFFASLLIEAGSGATYIFGIYSHDIKSSLGYDQSTLNLLGFFKDLGGNVGVISGLINEVSPPWVVLLMGAVMNISGYLVIWLAVAGKIPKPKVWQMCIYICVAANSQTFANTGALVTCVKNFPGSRGAVLGLLKGMVGLSGAILTQFYRAFYGDDSKGLILFIGWLPTLISFVFLRTIRIIEIQRLKSKEEGRSEMWILYRILFVLLALAGLLMGLIIVQNQFRFNRSAYIGSCAPVVLLLFLPLVVVVKEELDARNRLRTSNSASVLATESPPEGRSPQRHQQQQQSDSVESGCAVGICSPPARGEDYSILQALFSVDLLVLFVATTCGLGGVLTAVDNLGQIGHSLGYPQQSVTTAVSLVSIWSFLGRVGSGFGSEVLISKYRFPRPLFFTLILLLACAGHLLIAFNVPYSIYVASIVIGLSFGAQFTMLFAIISEIFGLKHYATLYNFGAVASPVGSYVLNVRVAGYLYDREALRQMAELGLTRKEGEELTCNGPNCFKLAFLVVAGVTLLGAVVSVVLVVRTWEFYRGDIYKRFREEGSGAEEEGGGDEVAAAAELPDNGRRGT